eukprot:GHUV01019684.1.p4 GENE.GHUV01019684.1~~GHUV01019684.1.p4  ORF type:complete len:112 (+),score=22.68 GHUV01019684.1:2754-3089(+)
MFMKLDAGKVYCLPDNYEVVDRSLDDIRAVLNPKFTPEVCDVVRMYGFAYFLDGLHHAGYEYFGCDICVIDDMKVAAGQVDCLPDRYEVVDGPWMTLYTYEQYSTLRLHYR